MATTNGKSKTRQTIKIQEMRELMFASGGYCAMTDCRQSLTSQTGGWVGTVAHIIGAEPGGPRGAGSAKPAERAKANNLLLMCAIHGREVDAPGTGEAHFPIDRLRLMKADHEARVTAAVTAAIAQVLSGIPTAANAVDTSLRSSTAAITAAGLAELLGEPLNVTASARLVKDMGEIQTSLQKLSQLALDTLATWLEIWLINCLKSDGSYDFGNGDPPSLSVHEISNRVVIRQVNDSGIAELLTSKLLERYVDEDARTEEYVLRSNWPRRDSFWFFAAVFLQEGLQTKVSTWVAGLNFGVFDRIPTGPNVSWK